MPSKRKLLVVVGAGASLDFGMPSVADVGNILSIQAQQHFALVSDPSKNLYDVVAQEIKSYWDTVSKAHLVRTPNFESILYGLLVLKSAYPHGLFTSPLGGLVTPKPLPDIISLDKETKVDAAVLSDPTAQIPS